MYGALLTAAAGACWPKACGAGLPHVELDESCVRCGAVRDDSFHQIWSGSVITAIPHESVQKSQHLFQRGKREKNTHFSGPEALSQAEWIEVPAAWEAVDPRVQHNSCDTLKKWAKSNCLIMFLDGTRGLFSSDPVLRRRGLGLAVLDFTIVFCARPWSSAEEAVSLAPSKLSPLWMFVGSELADRLAGKGAEAHQHSEWTVQGNCFGHDGTEVRCHCYLAHGRAVPPNKSIHVSCVAVLGSLHHWKNASGCSSMR